MTPRADYTGGRIVRHATPGLIWVACLVHTFPDDALVMETAVHETALLSMDSDLGGSLLPSEEPMHVTFTRRMP